MLKRIQLLTILSILQLVIFSCRALAQVKIYALDIPGLHQTDSKGAYDRVLEKILPEDNQAILEVYPPARAEKLFSACQDCCTSPANIDPEFYDYGAGVVSSEPMNTAKIYIFVPPGTPVVTSLIELKGKVVGTRFGMPYGKTFEASNLNRYEVSDLSEYIPLMQRGHIDAFIAYAPDIFDMFRNAGLEPFPHRPEKPYISHVDALVCRGVSDSLIKTINSRLKLLRENGELQEILGDRYMQ